MPHSVFAQPASPPRIAKITVDQYHSMIKAGILREGAPIELLDGLLVYKDRSTRGENPMSIGEPHSVVVELVHQVGQPLASFGCHMRTQNPISLAPHNEPEPDGAIVRGMQRDYLRHLPGPGDVYCVFEVADSSLLYDRTTKLQLYAQFSIPQYVILNLIDMQAEVYEQPMAAERRYAKKTIVKAGETLALLAGPSGPLKIPAAQVLP